MDAKGLYNHVELNCGRKEDIDRVCGPKGLRKRDKRHYFCANGTFWRITTLMPLFLDSNTFQANGLAVQTTLDVPVKTTRKLRRVKISIIRFEISSSQAPYKSNLRTNQRKTRNVLISTAVTIDQTNRARKNRRNTRRTNTSNPL